MGYISEPADLNKSAVADLSKSPKVANGSISAMQV